MAKMICTVGLPGSGKSTWAKSQVDFIRTCRDDLREALFGYPYKFTKSREQVVTEQRDRDIRTCINAGVDIIVDETNCNPKSRQHLINLAQELGCELEWKIMTDSFNVDLCHKRNTARERSVPYEVIENMFQGFIDFVKDREEGKWLPRFGNGHIPAVIVDVDGTIADHSDVRGPFEWDKVIYDKPKKHVIDLVNRLSNDHSIIILSGRDGSCREQTLDWLFDNDVDYDHFWIREAGDMRKDYEVKMELCVNYIEQDFDVRYVLDDRRQVCRYWEALGLNVLQVGVNNFF